MLCQQLLVCDLQAMVPENQLVKESVHREFIVKNLHTLIGAQQELVNMQKDLLEQRKRGKEEEQPSEQQEISKDMKSEKPLNELELIKEQTRLTETLLTTTWLMYPHQNTTRLMYRHQQADITSLLSYTNMYYQMACGLNNAKPPIRMFMYPTRMSHMSHMSHMLHRRHPSLDCGELCHLEQDIFHCHKYVLNCYDIL